MFLDISHPLSALVHLFIVDVRVKCEECPSVYSEKFKGD
jgi:hypothetical protein